MLRPSTEIVFSQGNIFDIAVDAVVISSRYRCQAGNPESLDYVVRERGGDRMTEFIRNWNKREKRSVSSLRISPSFDLPNSDYVFHSFSSVVKNKLTRTTEAQAFMCYWNCLVEARNLQLTSLAFPLLSTGRLRKYPVEEGFGIAILAIAHFLLTCPDSGIERVVLVTPQPTPRCVEIVHLDTPIVVTAATAEGTLRHLERRLIRKLGKGEFDVHEFGAKFASLAPESSQRGEKTVITKLFSQWRAFHEEEQSKVKDDVSDREVVMGFTWFEKNNKARHHNGANRQQPIDPKCGPGRGMNGACISQMLYLIRELAPNRKKLEGLRRMGEITKDPSCSGFSMTKDFYQIVKLGKKRDCHAGLLAYHQKSRLIVLYDSGLHRRNCTQFAKELYTPWVRAIFGRHFADTIPVHVNLGFELQPDNWSCAFRCLAGLLSMIQKQSPCGAMNVLEVARFIREILTRDEVDWKSLKSLRWRLAPTRPIPKYAPSAADPNMVRVDFANK